MEVLFVFLKWVASFSHIDEETGNMMDLENLAKVICPSILHSKGKDPSKDESMLSIQTITELLHYQDEFFTVSLLELVPHAEDAEMISRYPRSYSRSCQTRSFSQIPQSCLRKRFSRRPSCTCASGKGREDDRLQLQDHRSGVKSST